MNQKVGINVAATADTSQVEQAINAMGQKIAQANRVQYSPVAAKSIEDVKKLNSALAEVLKTQTGLRKRLKDTNQESTAFTDWDWNRMYPHAASRGIAMQSTFERVVGMGRFTAPPPPPHVPPPGGGGSGSGGGGGGGGSPHPAPHKPGDGSWQGTAAQVVQAGLRGAGPAGGVAAGSLGTGMSAGFGAGLMGLVGGLAALGVGKLVGAIAEKVGEAEKLSVDYDTLKRSLGDVGVEFKSLQSVLKGAAGQVSITYAEAGRLGAQFTKLSNLSGDQYKTLGDEIETGVGLSRSFGLDPSQGVGVLGQMRGMGITNNTQESRRFALLLGETIGKSGAFAKAEEVFDAIGGYATSQTRNSMGAANVAGYAGMYSSMVGSGIPGMDPAGAAGLLNKINSVLSAGGGKGEASQFFTGIVGHRMGLNPFQTQVLREGGAFATNNAMFGGGGKGRDSAYYRYMGKAGPSGSSTFLAETRAEIERQYPGQSEAQKERRAEAFANHATGGNINQAMSILSLDPNEMGEMQNAVGDLTKMSSKGIGNLSKALYGKREEREALRSDFLSRTGADALGADDRKTLESATTDGELKKALASMAAKYDQERTTGSDIRDSKNALDNIKMDLASRLIPMTQTMRDGILYMAGIAGGGKKSRLDVLKDIEDVESGSRTEGINKQINARSHPLRAKEDELRTRLRGLEPDSLLRAYRDKPEVLAQKLQERADVESELIQTNEKIKALEDERATLLGKENELRRTNIKAIEDTHAAERAGNLPPPGAPGDESAAESARHRRHGRAPGAAGAGGGYDPLNNTGSAGGDVIGSNLSDIPEGEQRNNVKAMLDAIAHVEGANYNTLVGHGRNNREITDLSRHPNRVGMVTPDGPSTATGRYQITGTTWGGVSKSLGLNDFSPESQDKAAIELIRRRGALDDVKRGDFAVAAKKLGGEWQGLPTGESQNQGKQSWGAFNAAIDRSLTESKGKMPAGTEVVQPKLAPAPAPTAEKGKMPDGVEVVQRRSKQPVESPQKSDESRKDGTPAGDLGAPVAGGGGGSGAGGAPTTHEVTVRLVDDKTGKPRTEEPVKIPIKVGPASASPGVTGQW